jgi:hypothetical protein
MALVNTDLHLECACFNPKVFTNIGYDDSNTVQYFHRQKLYLSAYIDEIKKHKENKSVSDKPCYGKQDTSIAVLKNSLQNHKKTLKRLSACALISGKEFIVSTTLKQDVKTNAITSLSGYIKSVYEFCNGWFNLLATTRHNTARTSIETLLHSCDLQTTTLVIYEEILNNQNVKVE